MQVMLAAVFLLLGLLNPVSGNWADLLLGSLAFGWCFSVIMLSRVRFLTRAGIGVLISIFLASSLVTSADLRKFLTSDLALYTYNNDPGVLYKTYLFLEQGFGYYESYRTAQLGRFEQPIVPGDIWGWRLPTIFYIWKILPGGGLSIYYLYLILATTTLYAAYQITRRYLGERLAILAPYLLFGYLHFGARNQMLLETEWWAVMVFIGGLYFLINSKKFWTAVLFSLTLLIREVYVLPIGLMLAWAFWKRRDLVPFLTIPLVAYFALFIFHISQVANYIDAWGTLFRPRTVGGTLLLQQTLAFASWEYFFYQLRLFLMFFLAAVLGLVYLIVKKKRQEAVFLILSFLPFPMAFLRFGTVPYNDYWGIIYMPLVLLMAPLVLVVFADRTRQAD